MGELKPLGSEKLSGDAKMKRILELAYYQSPTDRPKSAELIKETKTGIYGIVKEKDGYYVKKGLTKESLDYIGGLFMKNKNKFSSYNEAFKKLEFLTEQELVTEATKYVLKSPNPKPQAEAPAPMPTTDTTPPPPPAPDAGAAPDGSTPPPPAEDMTGDEAPEGNEDPNDYLKVIQKRTGKLTEKLNAYQEKLESKDIKYVINMVLAALDLDKMEDNDKEEILSKFEDEEDGAEPASDFATDGNGETPAPQETQEIDGISALDELISTPLESDDGDDDNNEMTPDDLDFLNSIDNKKATKFAKKDIEKEFKIDDDDEISSKDDEFPLYTGDKDVDEISDMGQMPNMSGEVPEENDIVKELDINELTNMVNTSVKETLGKYFEQ